MASQIKKLLFKRGVYKRAGSPRRSKFIEIDFLLMCMCNFNIIVYAYITLFYFARENILVCEIL